MRGTRLLALFAGLTPALAQVDLAQVDMDTYIGALRLARDGQASKAALALETLLRQTPDFHRGWYRLLQIRQHSGGPEKALEFFATLAAANPEQPYPYYGLSLYYTQRREWEPAEHNSRTCIGYRPEFLPCYGELLNAARHRNRLDQVLPLLEGLPRGVVREYALGAYYLRSKNHAKAFSHLTRARGLKPNDWEIADRLYVTLYETDRFPDALKLLGKMLKQAENDKDLEWTGRITGRMGMIETDLGEYAAAEAHLGSAVDVALDLGNRVGEQVFRGNLAAALICSGKYDPAFEQVRKALQLARELKDRRSEGRNLGMLATIHAELGEYGPAVVAFEQSVAIAKETADRPSEADQLASLSVMRMALGEPKKAAQSARNALALARSLKNPWLEGRCLQILGEALGKLDMHRESLATHEEGLRVARGVGDKLGEASRLALAGEARLRLGDSTGALANHLGAVELARSIGAGLIVGHLHNAAGRTLLSKGDFSGALQQHHFALESGMAARMPEVVWQAYAGLADVSGKTGNLDQAIVYYRRAANQIEETRGRLPLTDERAAFLADRLGVYQRAVRLLTGLHHKTPAGDSGAEAFHFAERARARALLDLLPDAGSGDETGADPRLLKQRAEAQIRLSRIQSQMLSDYGKPMVDTARARRLQGMLAAADDEWQAANRAIRTNMTSAQTVPGSAPITLGEAQALLGPKTAMLEYSLGPEQSLLFVLTSTRFEIVRLPPASRLKAAVESLREAIAAGPGRAGIAAYVEQGRWLHKSLVEPAAALLSGKTDLIVAPDGVLWLLPFEALLRSNTNHENISLSSLPYLNRDFAISYVPSAGALLALDRRGAAGSNRPSSFLGIGDPAGPNEQLTEARREVALIGKLFASGHSRTLVGPGATEENVTRLLNVAEGVVHFASHGLLREDLPRLSGLVLTQLPDGVQDGLLQAFEIAQLKARATLVVLSACDSGRGRVIQGEGLVGLTHAFLRAGAASVIVSLWKVDDRAAAGLMLSFYRNWLEKGLTKVEALRRARMSLTQQGEYAHPYFWAPFVLNGVSR